MKYDYEKNIQGVDSHLDVMRDKRTTRFIDAISQKISPKILEMGVGQGRFIKKVIYYRPDAKIYGIDISKNAIKNLKKTGIQGKFFVSDVDKTPFPPEYFDVVVIADVLEHLPSPAKAIKEINRILKPGGFFHFYVPCEREPYTLDWFFHKINFIPRFTNQHFGHIQYFSHQDIDNLVEGNFISLGKSYSDHLLTQVIHFFILYLPKMIIDIFGEKAKSQVRDANNQKSSGGLLTQLKKIWVIGISYPASLICELESLLLKNVSFAAKGLHVTLQRKNSF